MSTILYNFVIIMKILINNVINSHVLVIYVCLIYVLFIFLIIVLFKLSSHYIRWKLLYRILYTHTHTHAYVYIYSYALQIICIYIFGVIPNPLCHSCPLSCPLSPNTIERFQEASPHSAEYFWGKYLLNFVTSKLSERTVFFICDIVGE